jgi:hypothetical protein
LFEYDERFYDDMKKGEYVYERGVMAVLFVTVFL